MKMTKSEELALRAILLESLHEHPVYRRMEKLAKFLAVGLVGKFEVLAVVRLFLKDVDFFLAHGLSIVSHSTVALQATQYYWGVF